MQDFLTGLKRLIYYRLIVPIKRSQSSPVTLARGCMVGLAIGLTPTVGIQMLLVVFTWWISVYFFRWDFSLITGLAWSWVSNPLTMIPFYFTFYMTGQAILGGMGSALDYSQFHSLMAQQLSTDAEGLLQASINFFGFLLREYGYAILVGCLPYMLILPLVGYIYTLRLAKKFHERRASLFNR